MEALHMQVCGGCTETPGSAGHWLSVLFNLKGLMQEKATLRGTVLE